MAGLPKQKRNQAELAAEHALHEHFECTHTRRALRTKFAKVDFFGADVIGMNAEGRKFFIQVTAGGPSAVSARRKKLLPYPWASTDIVEVWQMVEQGKQGNTKLYAFNRWRLDTAMPVEIRPALARCGLLRSYSTCDTIEVKREWFKAYKEKPEEQG